MLKLRDNQAIVQIIIGRLWVFVLLGLANLIYI